MQDAGAGGNGEVWQVRGDGVSFAAHADRPVLLSAEAAGLRPDARAEQVDVAGFIRLANLPT